MRYLRKALEEGERPVCRSHLHGICLVSGLMWFAAIAGFGWLSDFLLWFNFGQYIPVYQVTIPYVSIGLEPGLFGWICTAGGALIFLSQLIKFLSTDILVTTKRVLYKIGLLKVRINATGIDDILGIHVDQGWFGQFLGYGKLHFDCRFIEDVYIPCVKNPYGLMKAVERIRNEHSRPHPVHEEKAMAQPTVIERPVSQTLIQISGNNPVYIVDKVPADERTPMAQLPKTIGDNLIRTFKRKA